LLLFLSAFDLWWDENDPVTTRKKREQFELFFFRSRTFCKERKRKKEKEEKKGEISSRSNYNG